MYRHWPMCLYISDFDQCACIFQTLINVLVYFRHWSLCLYISDVDQCACIFQTLINVLVYFRLWSMCFYISDFDQCACIFQTLITVFVYFRRWSMCWSPLCCLVGLRQWWTVCLVWVYSAQIIAHLSYPQCSARKLWN